MRSFNLLVVEGLVYVVLQEGTVVVATGRRASRVSRDGMNAKQRPMRHTPFVTAPRGACNLVPAQQDTLCWVNRDASFLTRRVI